MPPTSNQLPPADAGLERVIGVRALTAFAFNMTVGSGIFVLPAVVAAMLGAAAPVAYMICALMIGLVVLCFAEAGSRVSRTGGAYAYAVAAYGPYLGALCGALLYAGAGALASASIMNIFAGTLGVLFPALAGEVPRKVIMFLVYGGLALLNVRGSRPGVRTMELFTLGKLIPLLVLAVLGLFAMHANNLVIPALPSVSEIGRASVVLVFAFLGFENALNPSGEVKDPHRTVPRAVIYALGAVTVLYLTIQMVAQGVLGPSLAADSAAPLATVASVVIGGAGRGFILVGMLISTFGYLTGDVLTSPRALFALSEDGVLPPIFARVHPTFRTPWIAIWLHAALAFSLAVTGRYKELIVVASAAILLMYFFVCLGVLFMRRRGVVGGGPPFVIPGGPVVPIAAMMLLGWLMFNVKYKEWIATGITLVLATVLYVASLYLRRRYPVR